MAAEIQLRIYEELNDLVPPEIRKQRISFPLGNIRSVKELLACLNVPEKDVELVLVNGASVDFFHALHSGDFVSLYPVFESLDVSPVLRVRNRPLRQLRFIADKGLFRLAGYIRKLGLNILKAHLWTLDDIIRKSEEEKRVLLTRNRSLLKSPRFSRIYLVQADAPKDQLLEVLSRFDLFDSVHFSGAQPMLNRILRHKADKK